ncbi:MAG: TM0106 family RecB-like putative nuclease [Candidatus Nanopelagicales bacterium]
MSQHLITPSKITAWLECPHYLTLDSQVAAGTLIRPDSAIGSYGQLLRDKGDVHEKACLAAFDAAGKRIREMPTLAEGETFAHLVQRAGNPFGEDNWDVLFQMPFIHEGMRGTADFIERVIDPDTGAVSFEPIDSKLTRTAAKPGHVLQLCFYADGIEALTGIAPERMHIWLGSGHQESLRVAEFRPYWRRLRHRLAGEIEAGPTAATEPEPCAFCQFCEFSPRCEQQWREERSLVLVARVRRAERAELNDAGVTTLDSLADAAPPLDGIEDDRLGWLVQQASLQCRAETQATMPYGLVDSLKLAGDPEHDDYKHRLPKPDDGDVFIDFEGHPFWSIERGLFFLFGILRRTDAGDWTFDDHWAHTEIDERAAAAALINDLAERRKQFPDMHVYHYNNTERTALESLADGNPVAEAQIKDLVTTGAFIDLYRTVLTSIQIGADSYSLKRVEKLTDFERNHDIASGAGAVLTYEHYMKFGDNTDLTEIAAYNEDDVRATLAVRNWLVEHRPAGLQWRAPYLETDPEPTLTELREREVRLHAYGPDTDEHFLGDLIGYWWRERQADLGPKRAKFDQREQVLLEDPEVIAGLTKVDLITRTHSTTGAPILPAMRFTFPEQELGSWAAKGGGTIFVDPEANTRYATIADINRENHDVDFVWTEKLQEVNCIPSAVVRDTWFDDTAKAMALQGFADDVLDDQPLNPANLALLKSEAPRFAGEGPPGGIFTEDRAALQELIVRLDGSCLAIQGPPGTGKTFNGAHLIRTLVLAGKRVGVTAFSHSAINNLLREVFSIFEREGGIDQLRCIRQKSGAENLPTDVVLSDDNRRLAKPTFNVVAGSTWKFCSQALRDSPVDVLFIDEAGQLGLADALAASIAAHNLVLLGDPLQLAQVTKASHPNKSGRSVLDHILDGEETIPPNRGVFLSETRRMHGDICGFISQQIYEGRLEPHKDCDRQTTAAGTGLRWLKAEHHGNITSSSEEGDLILDAVRSLLGTDWTDNTGQTQPLTVDDFVVVTPYNDQRLLLEELFNREADTRGLHVATVDKFQGQEKAVVFFSMAASTGENVPRGTDFLFSRNRLNVAVSRARCLAYLVCTEELLNTRARDVEDMRLISTLNAFVEWAQRHASPKR